MNICHVKGYKRRSCPEQGKKAIKYLFTQTHLKFLKIKNCISSLPVKMFIQTEQARPMLTECF